MHTQRAGEREWPSVTVIVPVFNEERSITACLQSVVAQDYPADRMEIIVVDGMSTDRTCDIVCGFAEQDNRIRLLPSPKRYTPCSMNIGVAAAVGEVLVRVDGHSVITSEHVHRCVSLLQRSGADHVGGLMRQRGRTYLAKTIALALSSPVGVGSARFRYTDKEQDIDTVPFGAFHRDTVLRLGGFDEAFSVGQDSELDYRITLSGGRVRIDPSISTDYFCRESIPALARQFFFYGRAKAQILHKHGGLPSPRSLAPAAFLTTVAALALSASISDMAREMLAVTLAAYFTLCVAGAIVIGARRGWRHIPLLPAVLAVLHISHGAGFLSFMPRFLAPRPLDRLHGSLAINRPSSPSTSAMTQQPAERTQGGGLMIGAQALVSERPRIGYILSRFPKVSETFILREMEALEDLGWHIDVFPFIRLQEPRHQVQAERWLARLGAPDSMADIMLANLRWLRTAPRRLLGTYALLIRHLWRRPGELARGAVAVARGALWASRVREDQMAHVHAHFALHPVVAALTISRLTGVSFSFTGHSHDVYRHPAFLAEKVRRARFVVVVSHLLRERYIAPLVDEQDLGKVEVVRCGVEPALFRRRAAIRPETGLCLMTVARLIEVKGVAYLIEACRLLRERGLDVHCRIIGDGPLRRRLEEQIERVGLDGHIVLLGARTNAEIREVLGWATAFVLPSIVTPDGTMEGVPVSLMEAMAVGVPVVATRTGAIPELVENNVTGLLVEQRDAQALAAAIEQLHCDVPLATCLADAAHRRVASEFDLKTNVTLLDRLLLAAVTRINESSVRAGITHLTAPA